MSQLKANLFIIGAMKAGTTSFNEMLSQHPAIYFSPIKEPHYFITELPKNIYEPSRFFNLDNYFNTKFPNKLHIANIKEEKHYQKLFSLATKEYKYLAEGSTCYIHAPESAEKIYQYNPNAKIILVTREPLKRAFSHYMMDVGLGRTTQSFNDLLKQNLFDFKHNKISNWSYLKMSLYNENAQKYKTLFGRNFLIIKFEDFTSNKEATIEKICDFLEIENKDIAVQHNNASSNIKYKKLLYVLKKIGFKDIFSLLLPSKIKQSIFKKISSNKKTEINLDHDTLVELNAIFEKDYNETCNLI